MTSAALTAVDISEQKAAEQAVRDLASGLEARVRERTAQLQQAMERAEGANRAKSEFLSRMSHELRTPMNAILGFAQILEVSDPSPQQLRWAGEIRRAGNHLLSMIEDLLDLARIEVGRMAIRIESLDLGAIVVEAVAIVQPMIEARGLRLVLEEPCDATARVRADKLRLRQVLVNLLSNAAKYNREKGTITVHCARHGPNVRLAVTDTGAGIDAHKLARLFQPFERLGADTGSVEGTGIGLALSRQLADLMGATLGVDSAVGSGSTFWIELPYDDGRDDVAPLPPPAQAPVPAGKTELDLLYVEDNRSNVAVIEAFLAAERQVRLRTAADGDTALAMARELRPDIILLDIHLPGINGYAVLQQLRADPLLAPIPVVALSADAMPHDVQRGLAAGFDRYLTKPVLLGELMQVLRELMPVDPEPAARA